MKKTHSEPRVLVIGPAPGTMGGVATFIHNCMRAGLIDGSHTCFLSSFQDGSRSHKVWVAACALLRAVCLLAMHRSIQVVHVHAAVRGSFYRKLAFLCLAWFFRRRTVFHLHSGEIIPFFESGTAVRRWLIGRALKASTAVVVLSTETRTWVAGLTGRDDVHLIPNFVFKVLTSNDASHGSYALFLGDYSRRKGVDVLAKAWGSRSDLNQHLLLMHGRDCGMLDLLRSYAECSEGSVHVGDWITGSQKDALLASAACLVLPSRAEGAPMVILEAMSAGVPVVATRVGGVPGQVHDGVTGYLVESGDSDALADRLHALLCNDQMRLVMGERARERFEREFSPEAVTKRWRSLYATMMR